MNSKEVFDLIEEVAATSSKNDKISMLRLHSGDDLLRSVLAATYNPTVTYGIKRVPPRVTMLAQGIRFNDTTFEMLNHIANRRLSGKRMVQEIQNHLGLLDIDSAELFKRILLKDMRAGFSEETVNKVWPGLLPEFPYMRCSLLKDAKMDSFFDEPAISQEKADGMYANINLYADGAVLITSRAGTPFPNAVFADLIKDIQNTFHREHQMHGELLVERDGVVLAREIGNGILNSIASGGSFVANEKPVFMVWDAIPLTHIKAKGKYEVGYKKRLLHLCKMLDTAAKTYGPSSSVRLIPTRVVKNLKEAYGHYVEMLAKGKEGTILKRADAIWKDGTSKEQVKLKLEFECDLMVASIVPGDANGKNAGRPGSLRCCSLEGNLLVDVAIKGEAMRDAVEAAPADWIGRIMPVVSNMILEPSESSTYHSLFLPRFSQSTYRTDKTDADNLARIYAQQESAKMGKAIADEGEA